MGFPEKTAISIHKGNYFFIKSIKHHCEKIQPLYSLFIDGLPTTIADSSQQFYIMGRGWIPIQDIKIGNKIAMKIDILENQDIEIAEFYNIENENIPSWIYNISFYLAADFIIRFLSKFGHSFSSLITAISIQRLFIKLHIFVPITENNGKYEIHYNPHNKNNVFFTKEYIWFNVKNISISHDTKNIYHIHRTPNEEFFANNLLTKC
jgi:hypothetical protein